MRPRSSWSAPKKEELPHGVSLGDYMIERKLGSGGMGTVYAAVHPVIEKRVAIKVLRRDLSAQPEIVARFIQEARAINRIEHPNIVEVFGFGETDSQIYLVMELLNGTSLSERIDAERLMVTEVCDIIADITVALEAAHESGIIHRDLKPDNVFLARSHGKTTVKLLDFGIAKLVGSTLSEDTEPGTILGTPHYMAPEQARGLDDIDHRADIYSLGVMLFELLTGRRPFTGQTPMDVVTKHITDEAPDPTSYAPTLPLVADQLVSQMLRKDPAERPTLARVRELLEELRDAMFAIGTNPITRVYKPSPAQVAEVAEVIDDTAELVASLRGHRRLVAGAVSLAALVAGAIGLATLL